MSIIMYVLIGTLKLSIDMCSFFFLLSFLNNYSLRLKINAILGPITQTKVGCKMTKLPLVFYEND
jgi:hypothetical protein